MKNRKWLLVVSLVMALTLSLGGTLAYLTDTDADVNTMVLGNVQIVQNEQQRVEADGEFTNELEPFENDKPLLPYTDRVGATSDDVTIGDHDITLNDIYNNYIDKIVTVTNTGNSDAYVRTLVALPTGGTDHWRTYDAAADVWLHWNLIAGVYDHWDLEEVTGTTAEECIVVNGVEYEVWEFTHKAPLAPEETTFPAIRGLFMDKRVDMKDGGYVMNVGENVYPIENFADSEGKVNVLVLSQAVQAQGFDSASTALDEAFGVSNVENTSKWFNALYNEDGTVNEDAVGSPGDKNEDNNPPILGNWSEEAATEWGADGNYAITSAEDFAAFAKMVNAGDDFKNKTVTLDADVDLTGKYWTPIGNSTTPFKGTFDGQNHTVSNLNISMDGKSNVGLFGNTQNGAIKNLTVHNANVKGYLNVGAVAGQPYTTDYSNIKLTGLVKIDGDSYVGGIGGKNAYGDWTDITIDVSEGSYVYADSVIGGVAYRTYVGGVIGFAGEGNHTFSNITSNIDVEGTVCDVGGIIGIAHYNNKFVNCSSSGNVSITGASDESEAEEIGGIAGVWHNANGTTVTFDGCSYTGELSTNIPVDLSNNTIHGAAYSATGTGEVIVK